MSHEDPQKADQTAEIQSAAPKEVELEDLDAKGEARGGVAAGATWILSSASGVTMSLIKKRPSGQF